LGKRKFNQFSNGFISDPNVNASGNFNPNTASEETAQKREYEKIPKGQLFDILSEPFDYSGK